MGCFYILWDINFFVRLFFGFGVGMVIILGFFLDKVKLYCW